ncbi:MAG: phosphate/phosphite/phosphonate ABC transporter substrate-binding protein [Dechloromonas sp.]|nr:phosphate/phosphite/phosphonate ABC transporter substrate-binding protein [Dechloromonas sp.]
MNKPGYLAKLLILIGTLLSVLSAEAADAYSFAVVPQFDQRKLFTIWKPIVENVSKRTGIQLNLVATLTVPEFERELSKGSFDFVYANPYHVLREESRQGYIPLIRDKIPLRGILVVAKDSSFKTPADLDGQEMAIPSFNALGASLLLRADLAQLFKVKVNPVNVKTHSSVYLYVANGLIPAGGGVEKTLQEQEPAVRDLLRVLYTTREMPSHPIAAHPRVPPKVQQAVRQAILALNGSEEGRKLLREVPIQAAIPASMKDYAPMRDWGLSNYWVEP